MKFQKMIFIVFLINTSTTSGLDKLLNLNYRQQLSLFFKNIQKLTKELTYENIKKSIFLSIALNLISKGSILISVF